MKSKFMVVVAFAFACVGAWAFDYDLTDNDIGDCRLATLGGYVLARPVTIDLLPAATNEFGEKVAFPIRCRVIYKDQDLARQIKEGDSEQMQLTGELLNAWLAAYVQEKFADADLDELVEIYVSHRFVIMLQDGFPRYVAGRIAELPRGQRISVSAVTLEVRAADAFREAVTQRTATL